jgi:phage host-nuclease inhibitor protein Gam
MADMDVAIVADGIEEYAPPARSLREVRSIISRIGKKLHSRANRRRKIEERMERCRKELADLSDKLADSQDSARLSVLADRAYAYCDKHQAELEGRVDGRTVSFEDGSAFAWRDTPFALEVTDEDVLLKSIRDERLVRQLVTFVPRIDLAQIKKDPELRARLKGIKYERKTLFRIEPAETDERLETETGRERPAWEIKRPRSRVVA